MKVKEFLEELKDADPESEIRFQIREGCCGDVEDLDDPDIDVAKKGDFIWKEGMVEVIFPSLWFFDTCITMGSAKRAARAHKQNVYGEHWKPGDPNRRS